MIKFSTPDIDSNRALWFAGPPDEPRPALHHNISADVAIIGGGFTGISTAYHLSQRYPERRIVLLEARVLANGASGRNGGLVLNWVNGVDSQDPALTRRVYAATREGIDLIDALIRDNRLHVRRRKQGCAEILTDPRRADAAAARVERLRGWGIPLEFLSGPELRRRLRIEGAHGATFDPSEGQLNGVDLIRGLRPVLLSRGVEIYEETPVLSIEEGSTILLKTPRGEVRAKAIVLGTNGYTPRLGYFRRGIFPLHSHMIATGPLSPEEREALGWGELSGFSDDLDRISFGGLTPQDELTFGGGGNAAYSYLYGGRTQYPGSPGSAERHFQAIRRRLQQYFPKSEGLKIAWKWTGTLGITMSRVCSMGVRGEHRNVYYAVGYSGHGIVLANLAGKVLCDIYSGSDERWRDLPFYQKRLGGIPPDPLRWVGYQVYTKLTGRSPRRTE
jgi:gamma-glutamylputrescine oxidase